MARFKKSVALLVGTLALAAAAGLAQAETRFAVQDSTGTSDKMVVTDTGWIGIGNNNPQAGFHMRGTVYPGNVMRAEGSDATGGGGFLGYTVHSDNSWPKANERVGFFLFGTTNAATAYHGAGITANAEGDWSASSNPANFSFLTTDFNTAGLAARIERLRIAANGNIGIGTPAPSQRLEVDGGIRLNAAVNTVTLTAPVKPATCNSAVRGTIWLTQAASGDTLEICIKVDASNFAWVKLN